MSLPGPALDWQPPSPPAELCIRGGRLFDPRLGLDAPGDLLIADGCITAVGEPGGLEVAETCEVIDAEGLHIFPAFFDTHVHLRDPGRVDEEDVASGTHAAAAGGFCGVVAMPNTDPVVDSEAVLGHLRAKARASARVPTGFLGAITRGLAGDELTDMHELAAGGALGFTDDGRPVAAAQILRGALRYQRLCGRVLCLHEEEPSLSGGTMREGSVSAALGLSATPSIAESTMVLRDLAIQAHEGGRLHLQHLSAAESVEALERAKQRGLGVTAEVTPHHLTLTDEALWSLDGRFKMNPPLGSTDDRRTLVDALRSGVIDCVATDHAPHASQEKQQPLELCPMGVTGLETAFSVLYTDLCASGELSLETLVERMTQGAAVFGLAVPKLCVGAPADLCVVDLGAQWEVGKRGYASRSENNAFAGRTLWGKILMTQARGSVCYRDPALSAALASR